MYYEKLETRFNNTGPRIMATQSHTVHVMNRNDQWSHIHYNKHCDQYIPNHTNCLGKSIRVTRITRNKVNVNSNVRLEI